MTLMNFKKFNDQRKNNPIANINSNLIIVFLVSGIIDHWSLIIENFPN